LRAHDVVGRVVDGALVCDLRSVDPADDVAVLDALHAATAVAPR
jgi:hypothetical protein